ncbi:alpha/beta fold hydrolase [Plantibacter sp. YIM 135347]|uniref:alpha/beta fold hydrolase n=1 Tax=Plantibacter sp. YIM 135347 TaxID=3423919 RepID=UPI003D330935
MPVDSPYAALLDRVPVEERSVTVFGVETKFWDYGDSGASTTIVLVHGFRGDHHGLEPVVAQLSGVRILAPDLPGFGASAAFTDRPHNIASYSTWLPAFLDAVAPTGRLVVLGHSFGSIVVSAAVAGGLRPDDLVLVNPIAAPALEGPRGILTRLAVFYYQASAWLPEKLGFALLRSGAVVRIMSEAMAKTKDPALRRWIHDQHARYFSAFADRNVVLESFKASVSHDVSEYAEDIPTRTLLIAAERDDITPVAAQHVLQGRFADAQLHVIPRVGHLIHYEEPVVAAQQLTAFLATDHRAG